MRSFSSTQGLPVNIYLNIYIDGCYFEQYCATFSVVVDIIRRFVQSVVDCKDEGTKQRCLLRERNYFSHIIQFEVIIYKEFTLYWFFIIVVISLFLILCPYPYLFLHHFDLKISNLLLLKLLKCNKNSLVYLF